jgi:hypothetical protein
MNQSETSTALKHTSTRETNPRGKNCQNQNTKNTKKSIFPIFVANFILEAKENIREEGRGRKRKRKRALISF